MSGSVSSLTGLLGLLVHDSSATKQRLDTLTAQAGDGRIAETYAGLAAGGQVSLSVTPLIAHNQTWQNNIDAAAGRLGVTQTALTQINDIASSFYAQIGTLNGLDTSTIDSVAASARDALKQVAGLLDTTDGGVYVFAGQDSTNPPIPDPDGIGTSGFATQIAAAVGALGANGAAATSAATLAIAASNASGTTPFSASLSQPGAAAPAIQVGTGQTATVGILANANGDVTSTGSSTTGSYVRDVLRALATLGSLSSSQAGDSGFADLVSDTRTSLTDALTALNVDEGALGNRTSALQTRKTNLSDENTALQSQLSSAEDVDMTATLSDLTQTQTQLQASYQLIAGVQSLSLTKYLTG